jgi:LmbE family N-acetylglucosaminyl deacetylase
MKKHLLTLLFAFMAIGFAAAQTATPLRIVVLGAHPDDCDQDEGGTAILFAKMGHQVKFVSLTNGDAGHQTTGGGALAKRRIAEAQEAAKRFGIAEYVVLGNHDGELVPSLDVRLQVIREIRKWDADIVIAPRPNDYHPDHRYTGVLVQDAAYMVAVPNIAPEVPALKKNPVFLYGYDGFQRPNPFRPDIAVDITEVTEQKGYALDAHVSQFYEWLPWIGGYADQVPEGVEARKAWLTKRSIRPPSEEAKKAIEKWYGKDRVAKATNVETFEICEYGRQPNDDEIRALFPMLK